MKVQEKGYLFSLCLVLLLHLLSHFHNIGVEAAAETTVRGDDDNFSRLDFALFH